MEKKLRISHVSLLHKKFDLNTLNVGQALFHNNDNNNNNNNNNVALVVPLVVVAAVAVAVAAVVPVAEASVVVLVIVAVAVLSGSNSHISSIVGILWEAVLHLHAFAVCSALGTRRA
jgi:hypothetical protein